RPAREPGERRAARPARGGAGRGRSRGPQSPGFSLFSGDSDEGAQPHGAPGSWVWLWVWSLAPDAYCRVTFHSPSILARASRSSVAGAEVAPSLVLTSMSTMTTAEANFSSTVPTNTWLVLDVSASSGFFSNVSPRLGSVVFL